MSEIEEPSSFKMVNDEIFPKGIRVMAIDDDLFCLKFLQMQLVSCGYDVHVSQHPVSALNTLRKNKGNYDLVITDVRMPVMDGFKLSEIIDYEMDLPVIMISGDGEVNTVLEGIKHKACDYLVKPARMEELKLIWKHVIMKSLQKTKSVHLNMKPDNDSSSKDENTALHSMIKVNKQTKVNKNNTSNPRRKRKVYMQKNEVDAKCQGSLEEEVNSARKRIKISWVPELQNKFIAAVNKLGWDRATAKRVYDLMDVHGITLMQVSNYLQRYKTERKINNESGKQYLSMVNSAGFGANCIDSSSPPFDRQTENLHTVGYENHLITTPFTHYLLSDSKNGTNNSNFLPPPMYENLRENSSIRSEIRPFGNPQLASNQSLVQRVEHPASKVNNNFPCSIYQPGFASTAQGGNSQFVPVNDGHHQQYNAEFVPNLRSKINICRQIDTENYGKYEPNRINSSGLHATFLDHSQNEALFRNNGQLKIFTQRSL